MSPMVRHHTLFEERPCIPAMFIMSASSLKHIRKCNQNSILDVDYQCGGDRQEKSYCECPFRRNSLSQAVALLELHIRMWCHNHGASTSEIFTYVEDA